MSHHHTNQVGQSSDAASYILCHIIIHTMSHHHTYYVTGTLPTHSATSMRERRNLRSLQVEFWSLGRRRMGDTLRSGDA